MTKILVTWQADEAEVELIGSVLPGVDLVAPKVDRDRRIQDADTQRLVELASDADVLLGWAAPAELVRAAPRLRFISYFHHGVDNLPLALLRERHIAVANAIGVATVPVAEQAMAFVLALSKRMLENNRAVVEARWQDPGGSIELQGKRLLVVGYGSIGSEIARRARAFEMDVVGIRRNPDQAGQTEGPMYGIDSLDELLPTAQFVVLSVPLTAETRDLMGVEQFRLMRPSSYLVNIARGPIVNERAVYDALVQNEIAGYATDVWWDYAGVMPSPQHFPVPSRLGVNRLPNVLGSGDRGGAGKETRDRFIRYGAEAVLAHLEGRPPRHLANLDLGY